MSAIEARCDGHICLLSGVINFETAPELLGAVAEHIEAQGSVKNSTHVAADAATSGEISGASTGELIIDFSGVTQANSSALALLLEWKTLAARHNCALSHQNLPDSIRQLSEICQVSEFI